MAMSGGTAKLVSQGTPPSWPGPVSLYVYYKEKSQSIANNQTVLSLGVYVTTPSGWDIGAWTDWNGSYVGTATSGSNCKTFDGDIPNFAGTRWLVENQDITITHDNDGGKTVTIYWHWGVNSGWSGVMNNPSGSFSIDLTTIPRASSITAASNVTLGNKCSVKWTPKSSSFRYKLKFSLGEWSYTTGAIHPNVTSEYTYTGCTIPMDVANQIPNAKTSTMTATLYTYSNSGATTQVGSDSETFTVTVPDNTSTKPTVTMTLAPVGSLPSAFSGLYIQGLTKVKATLSASGKYGATIKSYSMKTDGKTYGSDYTSDYLSGYGDKTVYGYATDNRGYTGEIAKVINVIAYEKPKLENASALRCDENGNVNNAGTYLKITARRRYSPVLSGGVQKNFCQIRYRYKLNNAATYSSWTTILAGSSTSSDTVVTGALLGGALSTQNTYLVQVQAIDDIGEYGYTTITVPTEVVYWHRDGARGSLTFGGYVEEDDTFAIAPGKTFKVKSATGKDVTLSDTGWISMGLSNAVTEASMNLGRAGKGCFYRVINGNHVFVAFSCALSFAGTTMQINSASVPAAYRPARSIYTLCAVQGRALARVCLSSSGNVYVEFVQSLSSGESTSSYSTGWIDGYIDGWVG
jgi:hypothetical protein